ncbi:MAG TPA: GvpL/GvpF family gas vesicle protein [Candidatus Dormibacteraeota bacterium]|nr:GvpL/GvpF family gas vesicle protein [Candidatus Dormibacteraeota bacterium]
MKKAPPKRQRTKTTKSASSRSTTSAAVPKTAKSAVSVREDLHVRISESPVAPESAAGDGGRYVYGIVQAKERMDFGKIGIGGAGDQVYTVNFQDIAAVVSKAPMAILDPTRENALAHEHVIETVMKNHTIIPMSFGTVFRTDDDIREVLKGIHTSVQDVLHQMAGKLEFGLKVNWDRDAIIEELQQRDEEIRRFHHEIIRKELQSTYFARMQLGRMIDKALAERSTQYVREIYEALRVCCVASRDNQPIGDKMIMNAAFLVERQREAEFDSVVNKIAKKYGKRLKFKYTGPWPPYNFVNIRLKLERVSAS